MPNDPSALLAVIADLQTRLMQATAERDQCVQALAEASSRDSHVSYHGGAPGDDGIGPDHGTDNYRA